MPPPILRGIPVQQPRHIRRVNRGIVCLVVHAQQCLVILVQGGQVAVVHVISHVLVIRLVDIRTLLMRQQFIILMIVLIHHLVLRPVLV